MSMGAGKYDAECEAAREATSALVTLLIVLDGKRGSGFSLTALAGVQNTAIEKVPQLLRTVANQVEVDLAMEKKKAQH